MKKILSILLSVSMLIVFAACGSGETSSADSVPSSDAGEAETAENSEVVLPDFETTTYTGETFTRDDLKDAKVIVLNLWEPWCKPCISEMPELEKLYEDYKDKGLVVVGVYTTSDMEEDVKAIIADTGVSYPVIHAWENFGDFDAPYRPTTWMFDSEGNSLIESPESGVPKIGAYIFWSALVDAVL